MSLNNYSKYVFLFFLSLYAIHIDASHITGGQMSYKHVTNSTYSIQLDLFRDCNSGGASFDQSLSIGIYERYTSGLAGPAVYFIDTLTIESVEPIFDDCLEIPHLNCIEKGTYELFIDLPTIPDLESYVLVYQRCCRNNLNNILQAENSGISIWKEIGVNELAVANTSPTLNTNVHFDICPDQAFEFNIAALDSEGDSISYKLGYVYSGGGPDGATEPGNPSDCTGVVPSPPCPPPFDTLMYLPGFQYDIPLGASSMLVMDESTGNISGISSLQGNFIAGVEVQEFRNGDLLSTSYQELTFRIKMPSSNEYLEESNFSIYPNPASNSVNIELPSSGVDYSLSIKDLNGRELKEIKNILGDQYILDLDALKGILILELRAGNTSYFKKIICL